MTETTKLADVSERGRNWKYWCALLAMLACALPSYLYFTPAKPPGKEEIDLRLDAQRLTARIAEHDRLLRVWNQEELLRVFDEPSERTFIAKIEGGLLAVEGNRVLRSDGTYLSLPELVMQRVRPTPPGKPRSDEPRVISYARPGGNEGAWILWSNGSVTGGWGGFFGGHNLPYGKYDQATSDPVFSEEFDAKHLDGDGLLRNTRNPALSLKPMVTRDARAVASGGNFVLLLRGGGKVWASGGNEFGQLGTQAASYTGFQPVDGLRDVTAIAAGLRHGLALKKDGTVWRWGQDDLRYEFPDSDYKVMRPDLTPTPMHRAPTFDPVPRKVEGLRDIVAIHAAGGNSYAVDRAGSVWAWGGGACAQVPDANAEGAYRERTADGWLGPYAERPVRVKAVSEVVQLAASQSYVLVRLRNGTVWGWGCSTGLRMGLPELRAQSGVELPGRVWWDAPRQVRGIDSAKQIFATEQYGAVVKQDDTLWILGVGCPLCNYHRFAENYSYAYKVKPGTGGTRIVSFEVILSPLGSTVLKSAKPGEFGYYRVDDSSGRVDGVAPWEPGYLAAALSPQRVTKAFELPVAAKSVSKTAVPSGTLLALYLVVDGNLAAWRAQGTDAAPVGAKAYVSFPWANPGNLDSLVADRPLGPAGGIRLLWQDWRISALNIPMLDEHKWMARGLDTLSYGELPNHQMTGAQAGNRFWVTPR